MERLKYFLDDIERNNTAIVLTLWFAMLLTGSGLLARIMLVIVAIHYFRTGSLT